MTDDKTGEMLGVQRPIVFRFGSERARYEQPTHAEVLRSGQRWTGSYSTGVTG